MKIKRIRRLGIWRRQRERIFGTREPDRHAGPRGFFTPTWLGKYSALQPEEMPPRTPSIMDLFKKKKKKGLKKFKQGPPKSPEAPRGIPSMNHSHCWLMRTFSYRHFIHIIKLSRVYDDVRLGPVFSSSTNPCPPVHILHVIIKRVICCPHTSRTMPSRDYGIRRCWWTWRNI